MTRLLALGAFLLAAAAPPSPQLLREADDAFARGDLVAATARWEEARASDPESAELAYNLGVAKYRAGDYASAADLFREAAARAPAALAAKAMFNRGTSVYADALRSLDSKEAAGAPGAMPNANPTAPPAAGPDPTKLDEAIQDVEESLTHFRDAIVADPRDADSRANAERAWRLLKELQEERERQQQQQQQQQQDQQKQDQSQSDQSQSNDQNSQENQKQEEKQSQGQSPQQQDQGQQDQQQQQQDQSGKDEQAQKQSGSQDESQKNEERDSQANDEKNQGNSQSQRDQQNQQESQQQNQQQDHSGDKQDRDRPDAGNPKDSNGQQQKDQPAGSVDEKQGDTGDGAAEPKDQQSAAAGGAMKQSLPKLSREEAERILQAVRDKEKARRARLLEAQRARQMPAPRDW